MATGALISVNEYLSTSYDPDCDYVDGVIAERNVGDRDHSGLQGAIYAWLYTRRKSLNISVWVEQRVQVLPTRFRVPDVCVTLGVPDEQIFTKPPLICIEILSPDDRPPRLLQRVNDYLKMGVPYVWVLDPQTREAWIWTTGGMQQVNELRTENPAICVPLVELFEA